jgi:serine/threonine protein kinase
MLVCPVFSLLLLSFPCTVITAVFVVSSTCMTLPRTGSYGSVALALDHHNSKRRVAIKKINRVFAVFENAKRIYREIKILRCLEGHANIIPLLHIEKPK